jgi:hypothetical protein
MSSFLAKVFRLFGALALAALVVWSVRAWWLLRQAERAGGALAEVVNDDWPEDGLPKPDARAKLIEAAERLGEGDFAAVAADLGPVRELSPEAKAAAQRFLAEGGELRRRFIAVAGAAEALEEDGADLGAVRDGLARALRAASKKDRATVSARLESAEAAVERAQIVLPGEVARGTGDAAAVRRLVEEIEPAFLLGRELLTEGYPAAEKLVGRASGHYRAGEFRQAAALISLAAELLGVEAPPASGSSASKSPADGETPEESEPGVAAWFETLAETPPVPVSQAEAEAVVGLCEAAAMSESPAAPVMTLVKKARRELRSNSPDEAGWWASVALASLGMTEEAGAEAAAGADDEVPE